MRFDEAVAAVAGGSDVAEAAGQVVAAMTTDERLWCLDGDLPFWAGLEDLAGGGYHQAPFPAARVERLGVPGFAFVDGPRGVVVDRATCFPVSMARGATWDDELEERIGEAIGREVRAVGGDLFGGVCVNLLRHPAWGRAQETYGEDPHHVGEMGAALTRGVQRHAMACVKHFAANSMEEARFRVDVTVDEVALHEVYLPHFERIVEEGVAVVMSAYNSVNGQWCGESDRLLTAVLREEWGFDGYTISDFILGLRDARRSLRAGLDVEMPFRMIRAERLEATLDAGEVGWTDVDAAVKRVVATLLRFAPVLAASPPGDRDVLACAEHRALAREAATKAIVLLRNEPVDGRPALPLDPCSLHRLAVIGHLADVVNLGDGGSSDVWPPEVVTVADGLRAAMPSVDLVVDDGSDATAAADCAATADAVVVVVGYTHLEEGEYIGAEGSAHLSHLFPGPDRPADAAGLEAAVARRHPVEMPAHIATRGRGFSDGGDRRSLRLADADVALIRRVAAVNPRTVVVLVSGSAVLIDEWENAVPAVVQSWYSGMEGGHAVADVLLGRADPSGRLPFSVPAAEADLPPFDAEAEATVYDRWHGWWHLERTDRAPAYPFGFGLAYTTFELERAESTWAEDGAARVEVTVRNTGDRHGIDVVQVYARRAGSDRPSRLVAFGRVEVAAGESELLVMRAAAGAFAERDVEAHRMVVCPGRWDLRVARHAADAGLGVAIDIPAETA